MADVDAPSHGEDRKPAMSLGQTLFEALRHFVHLDESNAAIHCGKVRYSPLTFRLAEHLAAIDAEWFEDPYVSTVLSHVGAYAEDTGR